MTAPPEVIAAAREYFNQGYQVVAVKANKAPWGKNWRRAHNLDEVLKLLEEADCPAIGFLGGELNHGIVPIDFDTSEGDAWFCAQCEAAGIDPFEFPMVVTPGKLSADGKRRQGFHRYVTDIRGTLGNSTGPLLAELGIDIRGRGHAMLPPSPHPDGGTYQWMLAHNLLTDFPNGVPPCPLFLYEAIEARYGLGGAAEAPPEALGSPSQGNGADPEPEATFRGPPPLGGSADAPGGRGANYETRIRAYLEGAIEKSRARLAAVTEGQPLPGGKTRGRNAALNNEALGLGHWAHHGIYSSGQALSALMAACETNGLLRDDGTTQCHKSFWSGWNDGLAEPKELKDDEPPRPGFGSHGTGSGPDWSAEGAEYSRDKQEQAWEAPSQGFTPQEWADRDIPPADFLLGDLFSTTSRVMIGGPTGLGKTQFALAMAFAMAGGADFLHWSARRAARILYLDGEMSRRLAKERIVGAIKRFGSAPDNLVFINKEDFETMPPLNSEPGQAFVEHLIGQYGPFDFLTIDNIQAWCPGDLKSPESWAPVLPWVRILTKRHIGQLWIHHTGHEEDRLYGDKTREWQFDTIGLMTKPEKEDPERIIEFGLTFSKARERTPNNRSDFDPVSLWIDTDDTWQSDRGRVLRAMAPKQRPVKVPAPTPLDERFYEALAEALASPQAEPIEASAWRKATTIDNWRASCVNLGLLDKGKPDSARSMMSKYRTRLIDLKWVAIRGAFAWSTKEGSPLSEECERPQNTLNVEP